MLSGGAESFAERRDRGTLPNPTERVVGIAASFVNSRGGRIARATASHTYG